MKNRLDLFSCVLIGLALILPSREGVTQEPRMPCPGDAATWQTYRDFELATLLGFSSPPPPALVSALGEPGPGGYSASDVGACISSLGMGVQACISPVLSLINQRHDPGTVKSVPVSKDMSNEQYMSKYRDLLDLGAFPPALWNPALIGELSDPKTVDRGLARLRAAAKTSPEGWSVMKYDSITNNVYRIEIFIPGKTALDADRFVQYTISRPPQKDEPVPQRDPEAVGVLEAVDAIVVQKEDGGEPLEKPRLHFLTPNLVPAQGTPTKINLVMNKDLSQPTRSYNRSICFTCHQGSILTFHPPAGTVPQDARTALRLDEHVNAYGPTEDAAQEIRPWPGSAVSMHGPQIGELGRSRPDAFIASCAPGVAANRRGAIATAMNCAACHNGKTKQKNPLYLGSGGRLGLIQSTVTDRHAMPPGTALSIDERDGLVDCLLREASDEWNQSFNPTRCDGAAAARVQEYKTPGQESAPPR